MSRHMRRIITTWTDSHPLWVDDPEDTLLEHLDGVEYSWQYSPIDEGHLLTVSHKNRDAFMKSIRSAAENSNCSDDEAQFFQAILDMAVSQEWAEDQGLQILID